MDKFAELVVQQLTSGAWRVETAQMTSGDATVQKWVFELRKVDK